MNTQGKRYGMNQFMNTIGAENWILVSLQERHALDLFRVEGWWISKVGAPVNTRLPTYGSNNWQKLGRFKK